VGLGSVATGVSSSAGLFGLFLGMFPPILDQYNQNAYRLLPTKIPDFGTLVELRHRGLLPADEYRTKFRENGLNEGFADAIFTMSGSLLSAVDYFTLWRRGKIDISVRNDRLEKLRYNPTEIELVERLTEFFPSTGDLITFAVREVYTPEVVDKFGQLDDLPEKFMSEAKKVGLPDEQAKNYWASHWILPSILQGFEMFHRRVIDRETLNLLLKSLDIMPYWRDALTAISYRPLTRVDVRRMFGIGTLNEDEVFESYLDGGYSPENAERMTEFTKLFESDETTGLTRSSIMKSYKIGLISREQMEVYFKAFGYTPEVITFWLDTADYEKALDEIETIKNEQVDLFNMGSITITQMRTTLLAEDLPSEYIQEVVDGVEKTISTKLKLPTRTDLENWLKVNIITDVDYTKSMRMLGYVDKDILLYLEEITLEIDTSVRKYLGVKVYTRWFISGIIDRDKFIEITSAMGYSMEDIDRLMLEAEAEKNEGS